MFEVPRDYGISVQSNSRCRLRNPFQIGITGRLCDYCTPPYRALELLSLVTKQLFDIGGHSYIRRYGCVRPARESFLQFHEWKGNTKLRRAEGRGPEKWGTTPGGYQNQAINGKDSQNFWLKQTKATLWIFALILTGHNRIVWFRMEGD